MKKLLTIAVIALLTASGICVKAQDRPAEYLGLPGDNLNLYAVMDLFQKSKTLESFEKDLNSQDSRINNLDLNGDNLIDYITVNDYVDNNVHSIVLQDALSQNDKQDVAVFTVQRFNDGSVQIQLIGDEALYGRNYIVEPIYDDNMAETPNPGYTGNDNITVVRTTTLQIAAWPMIRFIYRPGYRVWRSSWYWGYYPSYWRPWNPFYWDYYYGYYHNWYPTYYSHYRLWNQPRYSRYNDYYYHGFRAHSDQVVVNVSNGHYKNTYSHPEQRRDGEALYSKTHSDRPSTVTSGNSRRSGNNNQVQTRTNASGSQSTGNSRRSSTSVNNRNSNGVSTGQNTRTNNADASLNKRSNRNISTDQNNGSSARSTGTTPARRVSKASSTPKRETVKSSGQSKSSGSSTRRSSTKSGSGGEKSKSKETKKESGGGSSSRRK